MQLLVAGCQDGVHLYRVSIDDIIQQGQEQLLRAAADIAAGKDQAELMQTSSSCGTSTRHPLPPLITASAWALDLSCLCHPFSCVICIWCAVLPGAAGETNAEGPSAATSTSSRERDWRWRDCINIKHLSQVGIPP